VLQSYSLPLLAVEIGGNTISPTLSIDGHSSSSSVRAPWSAQSSRVSPAPQTASLPFIDAVVSMIIMMSSGTGWLPLALAVAVAVMVIMDTTASMNGSDAVCGAGLTREDCALQGARTLLLELWPSIDKVGLMVFPPISTASRGNEYDCSTSSPTIEPYNASTTSSPFMTYEVIPLNPADYKLNNTDTTLNTSSNMTKAVRGGATGCKQGLTAVGGQGTFYAGAITAAQAALNNEGTVGTQKVIIILSDGDASSNTAPTHANQCRQAVTAAQAATAAGTWVYSIAYGAANGSSCSTDTSPYNNACRAMTDIASDPSKFFSDKGGSPVCTSASNPTITSLNQIFKQIGAGLSRVRLLPDNTT